LRRLIISLVIAAGAMAAGLTLSYQYARQLMKTPLPIAGEAIDFTIPAGTAFSRVVNNLASQGVLVHPGLFTAWASWKGQEGKIQAGEYRVPTGTTPLELLNIMVAGKVLQHAVTMIEGWNIVELLAGLSDETALEQTLVKADGGSDPGGLAKQLSLRFPHAEGLFAPETYHYTRGTTDRELLQRAHSAQMEQLEDAWISRDIGLPFETAYEALILASIVEKETALESERSLIAGVFVRRLQNRMRLQSDPTVIYGLGESYDGNIKKQDLESDTPYNTYTRRGLPPTPIALPGKAAIEAVMHPADGDALYFVASGRGDGSHVFSATLDEHNQAVQDFLRNRKNKPGAAQP
jgi:UPF0755 protein